MANGERSEELGPLIFWNISETEGCQGTNMAEIFVSSVKAVGSGTMKLDLVAIY